MTASATGSMLPEFLTPVGRRRLYIHDTAVMNDPGYVRPYLSAQHFFPERALWLSESQDMVVLARPLESAYLDYMHALGAGPQTILVTPFVNGAGATEALLTAPRGAAQLKLWADTAPTPVELSTFCTTGQTRNLAQMLARNGIDILPDPADPEATYRANHKVCARAALQNLNIPTIPGHVVTTSGRNLPADAEQLQQAVSELRKHHSQVLIRADYSSGGAGNLLLTETAGVCLQTWLAEHRDTRNFLVEPYIAWRSSPNAQYWIAPDGRTELIQITDQRIPDTSRYIGNTFPAAARDEVEIRRQSQVITGWLANTGVRGVIGIDFIDTYETGIRFVEINARVNGSTYASAIWLRLNHLRALRGLAPLNAWRMQRGITTALPDFAAIQAAAGDLLYSHGDGGGVIPYWTGAMQHGICSCVTVGADAAQAHALESAFLHRICSL